MPPAASFFDFFGTGTAHHLSWTAAGSDDAWLVLDRDDNGMVDNGKELFSNVAPQSRTPAGQVRNGFRALAMCDKTAHGGNDDGMIDTHDSVFSKLRLWQDQNHNGISESQELHTLLELGVQSISLDYKESRRTDRHGNTFWYRAKVEDTNRSAFGRWACDVFLLTEDAQHGQPSTSQTQIASQRLLTSISRFLEIPSLRWVGEDVSGRFTEHAVENH